MSMLDQFQRLDDLIIEHTQPPVRTMLRNQLSLTREQIEAYQAASDKQDETLSAQAEAISRLRQENAGLENQLSDLQARNKKSAGDFLREEAAKRRRLYDSSQLDHSV